jgi:hypothetical protein
MAKKILLTLGSIVLIVAGVAAVSAFESHVINVTAQIENALRVHSTRYDFGTVFPQEEFTGAKTYTFEVGTSDSFCAPDQTRVLNIDYKIVRKPKPLNPTDSEYCYEHRNDNPKPTDYYTRCYPTMCAALSAHPTPPGNDTGFDSYTNPETVIANGKLHKKVTLSDPLPDDRTDIWELDLKVPCFQGQCAQDWTHQGFELDPAFESHTFGCDYWVEVTNIY